MDPKIKSDLEARGVVIKDDEMPASVVVDFARYDATIKRSAEIDEATTPQSPKPLSK